MLKRSPTQPTVRVGDYWTINLKRFTLDLNDDKFNAKLKKYMGKRRQDMGSRQLRRIEKAIDECVKVQDDSKTNELSNAIEKILDQLRSVFIRLEDEQYK